MQNNARSLKSKINIIKSFNMTEIYTLIMLLLYSILALIFSGRLSNFWSLISLNILLISVVFAVALLAEKIHDNNAFLLFRRLYFVPIIFLIYSQIQQYIPFFNPYLYDNTLIKWDYFIFGVNPTQWLYKIANPYLTEYFQFSYMMYFVMPVVQGIDLHLSGRDKDLTVFSRIIVFTFYLSYLLYFFMPAIGPRFTLHDFTGTSLELPGLWITETFRYLVNTGGGIPPGALNPAEVVNRDCMPSGHTMITLVNIYMGFKLKTRFRWVIFVVGSSLVLATIYLRYHYVVDVIAGIAGAFLAVFLEKMSRNTFHNKYDFKNV
jgi:membrane-associated phospholipid phosphatase